MPSPFPGMDPYLEHPARWPDFRLTLIVALRAEINARLPKGFLASTDRHVRIERKSGRKRLREPDLSIVRESRKRIGTAQAATLERQQTVTLPIREAKGQPYLKVLDAQDRRVVTVLELLSPSNKSGEDHLEYLAKREEYFAARINLVEINLLRGGTHPPLGEVDPPQYYVLVCRFWDLPQAELRAFSVRDPFPEVPLPLKPGKEIVFDPRVSFDRAFEEAQYDAEIDYRRPPEPPLGKEDALWAKDILGRR